VKSNRTEKHGSTGWIPSGWRIATERDKPRLDERKGKVRYGRRCGKEYDRKCNVMEVGVEEGIRNGEEEREDVEGLKGVRTTLTVD
jgi:hypothetical protein